jgi:hypothetical protein
MSGYGRLPAVDHRQIWDSFCKRLSVGTDSVPLFAHSDDLTVERKERGSGKHQRHVLRRSDAMEQLVRAETKRLVADWEEEKHAYDGLIYLMFFKDREQVLPLYIGKTETLGKSAGNLSANIKGLDSGKFARWGYGYAYHIGDLSAVVLEGHPPSKINKKYEDWAQTLFTEFPTTKPRLKQQVYFWAKAWKKTDVGPWEDFGPTHLTFLEYLLIGIASSAHPELLLNREGQNR